MATTETFTTSGGLLHYFTSPSDQTITITLYGAGGGGGGAHAYVGSEGYGKGGDGANGSKIVVDYNASDGEELDIKLGEGGEFADRSDDSGDGGYCGGTGDGGNGGDSGYTSAGTGGGGGGAVFVVDGSGSDIAEAGGGGGGGGGGAYDGGSGSEGGGGGGGGRGGNGGVAWNDVSSNIGNEGNDGEGSGYGGSGGDAGGHIDINDTVHNDGGSYSPSQPGGTNAYQGTVVSQTEGGGASGGAGGVDGSVEGETGNDGYVEITYTQLSAPSAPQNLTLSVNGNDISLNWDSVDWNGDEGHYNVLRNQDNGGTWNSFDVSPGTTTYEDTGLLDGEKYYYKINAVNSAGTSTNSNTESGTTQFHVVDSLSASASGTDINLSWNDWNDNENGFEVFRGTSSGSLSSLTTLSANTESYTDSGLSGDTTYYYKVETYTEHTTKSSSEDSATTTGTPSTPQNLSSSSSGDDISLNWDSVNWNGDQGHYDIKRGTSSGSYSEINTVSSGTTSYTDSNLNDGERYYYVVQADNSQGGSGNSNETASTTNLPSPSGISSYNSGDDINISWNDNSNNEDGFRLYRSTYSGGWSQIADLGAGTTSDWDYNLNDGEKYYYYVEAYTEHRSSSSGETTSTTSLPSPSGVSASASGTDISLSWNDNSNNEDGFKVYRSTYSGGWTNVSTQGSNSTSYTDTGLSEGVQYHYLIQSYTEHSSSNSGESTATTNLPAPSGISVSASGDDITISWNDNSSNENGFKIYRSQDGSGFSSVNTVGANSTSWTNTGLPDGEKYYYYVRSYTGDTYSNSGQDSDVTHLPAPSNLSLSN